jgi:arylformamidase
MKALDLSHPLTEQTPHPESAPAASFEVCQDMPEKISRITTFTMCTHMGTHMDAPSHFVVGAKTITDYGMERFSLPAVVARPDLGDRVEITVAHLEPIERLLTPGCALLVATGMDVHYGTDAYTNHPYLSEDAAAWIRERGVTLVGIDFMTPDMPIHLRPEGYTCPVHIELLGNDVLIIENLTGLLGFDDEVVDLVAAPIALTGLDGAPVRVVAHTRSEEGTHS